MTDSVSVTNQIHTCTCIACYNTVIVLHNLPAAFRRCPLIVDDIRRSRSRTAKPWKNTNSQTELAAPTDVTDRRPYVLPTREGRRGHNFVSRSTREGRRG